MSTITIQLYSDIYIEDYVIYPELPVNAKYLFLAGNICRLNHPNFFPFFDYCSKNWEKVFYISGNSEFYSERKNMDEFEFEYHNKLKNRYKNVFYINNTFVKLDDNINVYGSTFWTNPPFNSTKDAKSYIKDYLYIYYFNKAERCIKNLNVNHVEKLSNESFDLLDKYLKNTNKKTIIMTHFSPNNKTDKLNNIRDPHINQYNNWSEEKIDELFLVNVPLWISGHTRNSHDLNINNIRYISNQLGKKFELGFTNFKEDGIFEITL
jgi:hypothetical protein